MGARGILLGNHPAGWRRGLIRQMKHDGCFIATVQWGEEGRQGGSCSNSWIESGGARFPGLAKGRGHWGP